MASTDIRTNSRGEVILPFFRVGAPNPDIQHMLDALAANKR